MKKLNLIGHPLILNIIPIGVVNGILAMLGVTSRYGNEMIGLVLLLNGVVFPGLMVWLNFRMRIRAKKKLFILEAISMLIGFTGAFGQIYWLNTKQEIQTGKNEQVLFAFYCLSLIIVSISCVAVQFVLFSRNVQRTKS